MNKPGLLAAVAATGLLLLASPGCLLLNEIGLNPGHVSGSEAKDIILDKTLINAALFLAARSQTNAALVFLAPTLAGINDDEYYKRSEVQECADQLFLWQYISTVLAPFACSLQPDNAIVDL